MLDKVKAVWSVFEAGKTVVNKQAWRTHQVSANAVTAFLFALVSLAKACGYDFGLDMQTCADIAVGVLALVNAGITVATSSHLGVKPILPSTSVREAQPSLSSYAEAEPAAETSSPVELPPISETAVQQCPADTVDDATRKRAEQWVRQHSVPAKPSINNSNGLANDA